MVERVEKAEENTEQKIKSARRLLVANTILLVFAAISPYVIPYFYPEISHINILVIMIILMVSYCVIVIRVTQMAKGMTSSTESLAEKMMKCKLRVEKGLDYCAKCPDGYACASGK